MAKDLFTAEWFPYYFERFEGSDRVAAMSLAEEGAYHRAIRIAWKYGSVPADSALLAAKIGKRCTERIADSILRMFEPLEGSPGRMIHPTVEAIRSEQLAKSSKYRKGGLETAKKRWGFEPDADICTQQRIDSGVQAGPQTGSGSSASSPATREGIKTPQH